MRVGSTRSYAYASRIKSDLCFCSSKPNYSTTEPRAALPLFLQTEQCFADTVRILSYPSRIATYLHRESLSHCLAPLNFVLPFRDASLKRSATALLVSALLCPCLSLLRLALLCLRRTAMLCHWITVQYRNITSLSFLHHSFARHIGAIPTPYITD